MRHALLALVVALGWSGHSVAQAPRRTLTRTVDAVVATGASIGTQLLGSPIDRLRLYAIQGGAAAPIRYQIDERNAAGEHCFDQGPVEGRVADEDGARLDPNDELVFMARDAGDRLQDPGCLPAHAGRVELEVLDPLPGGGTAWVYLLRFDGAAPDPVQGPPLVSLSFRTGDDGESRTTVWRGQRFELDNDQARKNAIRPTSLRFLAPDGRPGADLLDSLQIRAQATFMRLEIVRLTDDIEVHIGAWRAGPIRVIARNSLEVYLALGVWVSTPDSTIVLWPDRLTMPTNVYSPVNLDQGGDSHYTVCLDLAPVAQGWRFHTARNRTPAAIDGKTSQSERALDRSWSDWTCVHGPEGAILARFVLPDGMRHPTNELVYEDDERRRLPEETDGVEFHEGARGTHGFKVDIRGLKAGTHRGEYTLWYLPGPFAPGDERKYLDAVEHPLQLRATR